MFTKENKTVSLQTRYVYKRKQKVYRQVMFTKEKSTDKLCLQNKT